MARLGRYTPCSKTPRVLARSGCRSGLGTSRTRFPHFGWRAPLSRSTAACSGSGSQREQTGSQPPGERLRNRGKRPCPRTIDGQWRTPWIVHGQTVLGSTSPPRRSSIVGAASRALKGSCVNFRVVEDELRPLHPKDLIGLRFEVGAVAAGHNLHAGNLFAEAPPPRLGAA